MRLTRRQRYESAQEASRSANAINRVLDRSPWMVPLVIMAIGLLIGAGGFALANSSLPVLLQMLALVLISVSAVMLLFGLGGLASAVVVALTGRGRGKNE